VFCNNEPSNLAIMESITSLSAKAVQDVFSDLGIYKDEDATVGTRVEAMQRKGMDLESSDGLALCEECIFDDKRVRHVIESLFSWAGLGKYEVFRAKQETIFAFMTGLEPFYAVVVQLWSPNSKVVFFKGSQHLQILGFPSSMGILEIPLAPLKNHCEPLTIEMKQGGLVIFDARISFRIERGFAIHGVFAPENELEKWQKRVMAEDLEKQARNMETEFMGWGMNFKFSTQKRE
jgi:hypothetical protein